MLVFPLFVVGLHFFLILFGGSDFVRTFAARNSVWSSAPGCIPGSVAPFAISFYVLNKILRIVNAVQYEISPIVFSDNYIGFYVTYSCLEDMRLNNSFNSFMALCYTNIR